MQAFPASAEEFYALRDDRTNRCVDREDYATARVALVVDSARSDTPSGWTMLEMSAALLARWCRQVTIVTSDNVDLQNVLASMRDADPFGRFEQADIVPVDANFVLRIGGQGLRSDVRIDAAGWTAALSPGDALPDLGPEMQHTLGAAAAACFGVAEIFRRAVGNSAFCGTRIFDLFRLAFVDAPSIASEPAENLGGILLVGGGAVGSSMAYVVSRCGFSGDFLVIDFDRIKIENFNRSPLFARSTHNDFKAEAIASALRSAGSSADVFIGDWDAFVRAGKLGDYRTWTWVPVANERGVRRSIQKNLPPRTVHASTSKNWGVNFGRHLCDSDGCLLCRFPAEPLTESALSCSTGIVQTAAGGEVDAALPFVSVFAGVCIAAELARQSLSDYDASTPNYLLFDFVPYGFGIHAFSRPPLANCDCIRERPTWALLNHAEASRPSRGVIT